MREETKDTGGRRSSHRRSCTRTHEIARTQSYEILLQITLRWRNMDETNRRRIHASVSSPTLGKRVHLRGAGARSRARVSESPTVRCPENSVRDATI